MIPVRVRDEEKKRCLDFARSIIERGDQFNRFNQSKSVQTTRTYVGKLAEYVFLHFLHSHGVHYDVGDMFEIFEGQQNADSYDFITADKKTVDIKTASLPFHKRIMIPISQFHLKKDFYVGIKLNFSCGKDKEIDPMSIQDCIIHGYVERSLLESQPTKNFGEGYCKAYELTQLNSISQLIERFKL